MNEPGGLSPHDADRTPSAEPMPGDTTPPAPLPRWLRMLFPSLTGLENNPLYIRFAGLGLGRRSRWYRRALPGELHRSKGDIVGRLGAAPIVLMVALYGVVLARGIFRSGGASTVPTVIFVLFGALVQLSLLVFIVGFFLSGKSPIIRRFLHNGAEEPWGEALYLTFLEPHEYGRALFAASFQRSARGVLFGTVLIVAVTELILMAGILGGQSALSVWELLVWPLRVVSLAIPLALEWMLLTAINLTLSIQLAGEYARSGWIAIVLHNLASVLYFTITHMPGAFVAIVILTVQLRLGVAQRHPWVVGVTLLYAFVALNLPLGLFLARRSLRGGEDRLGHAFRMMLERKGAGEKKPNRP